MAHFQGMVQGQKWPSKKKQGTTVSWSQAAEYVSCVTKRAWYNDPAWPSIESTAPESQAYGLKSKTLVNNVPTAEQLAQFARLQLDTLVMAKGDKQEEGR